MKLKYSKMYNQMRKLFFFLLKQAHPIPIGFGGHSGIVRRKKKKKRQLTKNNNFIIHKNFSYEPL